MTPKQAKDAAARGGRYMDRHLPGWYREIDRHKLDMANDRQCILGQAAPIVYRLHPDYYIDQSRPYGSLREYWGLDYREEVEPGHRYTVDSLGFYSVDEEAYDLLTEAWLDEIERRLEADRAAH